MKLQTERHNGICTQCRTEVPVDEIVCTGCRARWGFSNGFNRQQLYNAFKFQYFYGRLLVLGSILTVVFVYFFGTSDSGANFWPGLGAFIVFIVGSAPMIRDWQQTMIAKKGNLDWWRAQ